MCLFADSWQGVGRLAGASLGPEVHERADLLLHDAAHLAFLPRAAAAQTAAGRLLMGAARVQGAKVDVPGSIDSAPGQGAETPVILYMMEACV